MAIDVPQRLSQLLDLERAWRRVWRDRSSDFIVPTLVYSAVRSNPNAVLDSLMAELESGHYRPSGIRVIEVPKPDHTTRPAGILNLKDRILYQALVDAVADVADRKLFTEPTVFGFNVNPDRTSEQFLLPGGFNEFRERVATDFAAGYQHVLESDISAYFECVQERFLQEALLGFDVDASIVEMLARLLSQWNRLVPVGLPQGVWPSDYLGARVYLDRVDKGMLHRNHRFFRYSDDIRVTGKSRLTIRTALRDMVVELRAVGLHVQSAKTNLLCPDDARRTINRLHERLARREDLAELLDLDPYGYTSAEETLRELTEPEITRSENLLDALMEEAYGDGTAPDFELCRTCITGYRRIKSTHALEIALDLLNKLPALTKEIVQYLRLISTDANATRIKNAAVSVLRRRTTIHDWQKHWLLHLLNAPAVRSRLSSAIVSHIFDIARDRNTGWSVRVMAIRLTGTLGDEPKLRELKNLYSGESDLDVRHAILQSVSRLPRPETTTFYRICVGADPQTDLVIGYVRSRLERRRLAQS